MEAVEFKFTDHKPYTNVLQVYEEWIDNGDILKLEFYMKYPGERYIVSPLTNSAYDRVRKVMEESADKIVEEFLLRVFEVEL